MPDRPRAERPVDSVVSCLDRKGFDPQPCGPGQWRSRCPVHTGQSHNLSIREASDGAVLLHCHHVENGRGTCSAAAIVSVLGLTLKDLFPPRAPLAPKRQSTKKGSIPVMGQGRPSAEAAIASVVKQLGEPSNSWTYYELHDGQRFELMRVYRFDLADGSKQFRPVNVSADGWRLGDPPGKLPLYNLPEISGSDLVVVVEGEKCCDLVRMLGLVATTSAHGSKSPAKTDWTPLAGKNVVLIPDNDDSGEAYDLAVAGMLYALDPKPTIRFLRLPLTEKGHDIEEWLKGSVPEMWSLVDCRIELERLWAAVPPWTPPAETPPPERPGRGDEVAPNLTELGNARRMVAAYGEQMRYCYPNGKWLTWNGHRWTEDDTGEIWRWAKEIVRQIPKEAIEVEDSQEREAILRWALRSHQKKILQSTIDLCWSEPGVGVMPDDFDRDPYLLNCPNGVVNLLTGEIRPPKPEDFLSKSTAVAYDPSHGCPRWLSTLDEIFAGDQELIAYVQRAAGYSLTGDVSEHAMFFCYGTGRNGKNTVCDTIRDVMGDASGTSYAAVVDPKIFLTAGQHEHPAAIAALVGRRTVITGEMEMGQQFAQGLVKRLTGERMMKTRFMRGNWFEFTVQFKLWMHANYKPDITGQDEGIWSRIRIIPFDVFIPPEKRVKGLSQILVREEGPGILAWLVEGARQWKLLGGLKEPNRVTKAEQDYRAEQDVIGTFLNQCTRSFLDHDAAGAIPRTKASALYACYASWCEKSGEPEILSSRKFGSEISKRGYTLTGINGSQWRLGITLCESVSET
jgi:putative DNA primase/helicase